MSIFCTPKLAKWTNLEPQIALYALKCLFAAKLSSSAMSRSNTASKPTQWCAFVVQQRQPFMTTLPGINCVAILHSRRSMSTAVSFAQPSFTLPKIKATLSTWPTSTLSIGMKFPPLGLSVSFARFMWQICNIMP